MADFSTSGSDAFWQKRNDPALVRIIKSMERVESWTLDGCPDVEDAIAKLGQAFEGVSKFEMDDEGHFITLLSHIKAARALHIMQHLDQLSPGSASKLLVYAESATGDHQDQSAFFLNRNLVFERLQLIGRIFAQPRMALALEAIEHSGDVI